ncbi:hypothetical protein P8452_02366 [Trifolium repens]|nr:hypothetical protein P8452_02366 [Trifolium repens]
MASSWLLHGPLAERWGNKIVQSVFSSTFPYEHNESGFPPVLEEKKTWEKSKSPSFYWDPGLFSESVSFVVDQEQ